jgi:hypothetical protein
MRRSRIVAWRNVAFMNLFGPIALFIVLPVWGISFAAIVFGKVGCARLLCRRRRWRRKRSPTWLRVKT